MTTEHQAHWQRDRRVLWHPFTRQSALDGPPFPMITRGEGPYLYDADGKRYLDAISSWWCCQLGHSHPRIVEAIRRQAATLQHSILGNLSHAPAVELAEALTALLPGRPRRVFYASDGASAIEAAMKMAVQYWANLGRRGKHRFLCFQQDYHGDTLGAVSIGYVESFHSAFKPLLFDALRCAPLCDGARGLGVRPQACAPACFAPAERLIATHASELAAVVIEPMCQAAAGMRLHAAAALRAMAEACRRHGVLLIADEIAMGFGRTGRMFAHEHAGIEPDIVCVGKGLSGGALPISATIATDAIYQTFRDTPEDRTFYHGHTFAGNPIACAAALAALTVYRDEDIPARAARMGALIAEGLGALEGHAGIEDVRCLGAIGAIEFTQRPDVVSAALRAEGILVRPLGNVLYIAPPLNTPEPLLGDLVARLLSQALRVNEPRTT